MKTVLELKSGERLPSPKGVALTLMELCRREDVTANQVADVLKADPALSGRLIQKANLAANRGGRPIVSIREAVLSLGINAVRQLALGFTLVDQHKNGACKGFDYANFWSHSLLMGVAMQNFGSYIKAGSGEDLFTCGLMARIGSLALATAYPVEYAELLAKAGTDVDLLLQEKQQLEIDHAELSAAMLTDWGLPQMLVDPVAHIDTPEDSNTPPESRQRLLVTALQLSKRLADLGVAKETERNRIVAELILLGGKYGMATEEFGSLIDQVLVQWQEWGAILKVQTASLPKFAQLEIAEVPRHPLEAGATVLRILLVEDDAATRKLLEKLLLSHGHEVRSACNGREAMRMAMDVLPEVVLTDWMMPEMDGLELCQTLRSTEWGRSVYVLMLTSLGDKEDLIRAFEAGVDDYVTKPVDIRALQARLRAAWRYVRLHAEWEHDRANLKQFAAELAIANRKLKLASLTDPLTGLFNRRAAMDLLDQAWSAASRNHTPLSVLSIDIDHFKLINDEYGHAVGDFALKEVADSLRSAARKEDNLCRIGGEEFLVICQNSDLEASRRSAERLRQNIQSHTIENGQVQLKITVSIGVAKRDKSIPDIDALVRASDTALYAAKKGGRNRTYVFTPGVVACNDQL